MELSSRALAPVGGVIPAFIKRQCTANCGCQGFSVTREEVAALDESGRYVQPMVVDDAVKRAGGAQKLLDAVNSREGNAFFLTRSTFSAIYEHDYWGAIFSPLILAYTGYLAAHPEQVEEMRLDEIAIPESRGAQYHGEGWAFFPVGKYKELKASYTWCPAAFSTEEQSITVKAPWNGSSSSTGTPSPVTSPPKTPGPDG